MQLCCLVVEMDPPCVRGRHWPDWSCYQQSEELRDPTECPFPRWEVYAKISDRLRETAVSLKVKGCVFCNKGIQTAFKTRRGRCLYDFREGRRF